MTRVWEVNDPICEYRGGRWKVGAVAHSDKWAVTIRWAGADFLAYRSPGDVHLVDPEQVPVDERHWVPAKVRDQLVRQEAAERLRAFAHALLPMDGLAWVRLGELAADLDNVLLGHDGFAAAARALLAPVPQPAATP